MYLCTKGSVNAVIQLAGFGTANKVQNNWSTDWHHQMIAMCAGAGGSGHVIVIEAAHRQHRETHQGE